jgi:leucyl aminopeptidase (aminopeptidase T)
MITQLQTVVQLLRSSKGRIMPDIRVQKLAHVLVHYSLALKPNDKGAHVGPAAALPLIRELYREAIRVGARVLPRITDTDLDEILLKEGSLEQIEWVPDLASNEIEYIDASLTIWSETNTKYLSNVDPQRLAARRKASAALMQRFCNALARHAALERDTLSYRSARTRCQYVAERVRRFCVWCRFAERARPGCRLATGS